MTIHLFLYLDAHRLSAYTWQRGELSPKAAFETDEEGLQQFSKFLKTQKKTECSLLVNQTEEGHIVETIPFLQGGDRKALLTRKIGQHFLGTQYATAVSLGYEKAKRKNEKVLISALTNPAAIDPWVQRINDAGVPLKGIYSQAQLSGLLLQKLGFKDSRSLLLTQQEHSIRESYLVDGKTMFSRMAPIHDSSIAGVASTLFSESGKLHQYLLGQRLISQSDQVSTIIIAHPQTLPAIEHSFAEQQKLNFIIVDCHQAAQKLGLHTLPENQHSELLFLHLLATTAPRQQFASTIHRHDYQLAQIRRGILASALTILFGALLFSAQSFYQAYSLRQKTLVLAENEAELSARYREISATFPQLGIDNDTLRRLTARHLNLSQQQKYPDTAYRHIGKILNQMPQITLDSIEWKIDRSATSTVANLSGDTESTLIRGQIQPEPNVTARQILEIFDQLVQSFKADPAFSINVLQQPFDMNSSQAIKGGDNQSDMMQARPFTIQMQRKIVP